jgi:class 3 adenylate cyclase
MGDGVLVYFGYPHAHEDDAERAVRAGLKLVAAVSDLKTHAALQTRVGIATGLVVVGDLIGSGASQEQAIVGETPNPRLQGIAEQNSVVIAERKSSLAICSSFRTWERRTSKAIESLTTTNVCEFSFALP